MTTKETARYYGIARLVPVDVHMAVGAVLRSAWGDTGYALGMEVSDGLSRFVFRCHHSDGSDWFLEVDRFCNVYETENIDGTWIRGPRT